VEKRSGSGERQRAHEREHDQRAQDGAVESLQANDERAVVGRAEAGHDVVGPVAEPAGREPHRESGGKQGEGLPVRFGHAVTIGASAEANNGETRNGR
jgi:hypothetical protein